MSDINFSDPAVIAALSTALTQAGVDGIEIEHGHQKLRIVVERNGAGLVRIDVANDAQTHVVKAPLAGIFRPASGALPRDVAAGEILGFVVVGPVILPVKTGKSGLLTRVVTNGDALVGFGDPLFEIELRQ